MKKRLFSVLMPFGLTPFVLTPFVLTTATVMVFSRQVQAQKLAPVQEDGRTIWVNDEAPAQPKPASAAGATSRYSNLVYWSSKQHRWVPVPRLSSPTMRAARQAAQEVTGYASKAPAAGKGRGTSTAPTPAAMDSVIEAAATRHGVDPNLVRAIVRVESNFNPHAVSRKGAMGLMQLMPATAQSMNVSNAFDPNQNVDAGVRHLKSLLDNYNGNVPLTLAAYNAGSGAVKRNNGIPPFRETQDYVRKITKLYNYNGGIVPARTFRVSRDEQGHMVISND
jgi:soluble lytic murein transglycosylase-like protein